MKPSIHFALARSRTDINYRIAAMVQQTAVKPHPNTATIQWSQPQALPDKRAELFTNLLNPFTASENTE